MRWTKEEKEFLGGNGGVFYDSEADDSSSALPGPAPFKDDRSEGTLKFGLLYQPNFGAKST